MQARTKRTPIPMIIAVIIVAHYISHFSYYMAFGEFPFTNLGEFGSGSTEEAKTLTNIETSFSFIFSGAFFSISVALILIVSKAKFHLATSIALVLSPLIYYGSYIAAPFIQPDAAGTFLFVFSIAMIAYIVYTLAFYIDFRKRLKAPIYARLLIPAAICQVIFSIFTQSEFKLSAETIVLMCQLTWQPFFVWFLLAHYD